MSDSEGSSSSSSDSAEEEKEERVDQKQGECVYVLSWAFRMCLDTPSFIAIRCRLIQVTSHYKCRPRGSQSLVLRPY